MADKIFENNQVTIAGKIVSDFVFSHEVYGEGFYMIDVSVNRLSNFVDYIPVMVSERLIDTTQNYIGQYIYVTGQFRSYNRHEEKKNRLVLSVFARELEFMEQEEEDVKSNQIFLDGYICKEPIYRKTPLGREIADLLIAVNRSYGKSDYIPCICWGRNARFASGFTVGAHVQIWGRIQSREYVKNSMSWKRKNGLLMKCPSAKLNIWTIRVIKEGIFVRFDENEGNSYKKRQKICILYRSVVS
ncbi:Single-stranded DNA-binding protein [Eubacterium plexicaudatum ASF492]|nr:Single-stranded DNA-binding protein [Eubacterium plexicaudatum ASF492]